VPAFSRPLSSPSTGCGTSSTTTARGGSRDLRKLRAGKPRLGEARKRAPKGAPVLGYIGEQDDHEEYWIPGPIFKKIAGGARQERALEEELYTKRLLATDRRGERVSYVVKRALPDGRRPNFVVLLEQARRRQGAG
jgi:hypothetical protein